VSVVGPSDRPTPNCYMAVVCKTDSTILRALAADECLPGSTARKSNCREARCQYLPRGRLSIVGFDNPNQAAVEFLGIGRVQELVGSVRVGVRTEHAGDQKLSAREALA
jgi:hypothetical protein